MDTILDNRLDRIIEVIMHVAKGDYSAQVELSDGNDKLDSLAIGVNMMIDDIRENYNELQQTQRATLNIMEDLDTQQKELGVINKQLQQEIIERTKTEKALRQSDDKWCSLTENTNDTIVIVDNNNIIQHINKTIPPTTPKGIVGKSVYEYVQKEHHDVIRESLKKVYKTGDPDSYEVTLDMSAINPKMDAPWFNTKVVPIKHDKGVTGVIMIATDITKRKLVEKKIQTTLKEKETLLKEVHHRVKNNLQVISSLLNLQSTYLNDKNVSEIFNETKNRVKAMALVHEQLYLSKDMSSINSANYIKTLTQKLFRTYKDRSANLTLNINIDETVIDIDRAIPCGLIINELVTNSIKYAFSDAENGRISVEFQGDNDKFVLSVCDNGIGFPEDIDFRNTKSLGLQLVCSLSQQLHGDIALDRNNGTIFRITFNK